ncbi:DUF1839 family protein [Cupriavidus sp. AU9028]|uniref:DUF1839 family protein n=1 Tax=Cupriavidus sp. AU9028 TaxID=2871157 RepID=UPI001C941A09|nr:DUF1839 family protein [Cupriavidus sp. AU9028]MBY4896861.1 DUF1839 family protein [Cupriavidus sp. AU9028]
MFDDRPQRYHIVHNPHYLHTEQAVWPQTNCHIDLWVELLHGWELDPLAGLAFTVAQDFEGDQFTFFKYPATDVERLYGIVTQELALYDGLEHHVATQTARGNVVLLEVDGYYLPDNGAISYRCRHERTVIGIDVLMPEARGVGYYHNDGYHVARGDDYDGLFRLLPELAGDERLLMPHAELVRRRFPPLQGPLQLRESLALLRYHLSRRPRQNPVTAYRRVFPQHMEGLADRGEAAFHPYAFHVLRQLGANFELLGKYLRWLAAQGQPLPSSIAAACQRIASEAMVMQFRLIRSVLNRRPDFCHDCFDQLEASYDAAVPALAAHMGEADS